MEELCNYCKHPFGPHRLLGYGSPPTEGWMECPVEGCDCKATWSASPELKAEVEAGRNKSEIDAGQEKAPGSKDFLRLLKSWAAGHLKKH